MRTCEVEGAIESFELAFKMQSEMPNVMGLTKKLQATLDAYGIGTDSPTDNFGRKCLLAGRMVEAGVRFVEVMHSDWDHHFKLSKDLPDTCMAVDQPIAALLADLGAHGMLKDTLVVWSGEFGRTPHGQGAMDAITTTRASPPGWPAAESKAVCATAAPTNRLRGRGGQDAHPRSACDDPASARPRSRTAHLSLCWS
jgi:hypothetical protein